MEALWEPSAAAIADTNLARYVDWLNLERGYAFSVADYDQLRRWSVADPDAFWRSIWDVFEVIADGTPEHALADASMPGAQWFPGTRLNHAEHIFRGKDDATVAIIADGEIGNRREITWGALRDETRKIAGALRALGVAEGDRVVAFLPNIPETISAFLAVASVGAIWSSCSPDFGPRKSLRSEMSFAASLASGETA